MTEGKELALRQEGTRTVEQVKAQIATVQELMKSAMKEDEHWGTIPGCGKKPSLLKPGAEKLSFMFRLIPTFEITKNEYDNGHREYEIVCILTHAESNIVMGSGVGSCSTMESKYKYRTGVDVLGGSEAIPNDYKEKKALYAKDGFVCRKVNEEWKWCQKFKNENPDIADVYNTVLKMAKKRAHVDAVLTATAASDIFTQDIEDFKDVYASMNEEIEQQKAAAAKAVVVEKEEKPAAPKKTTTTTKKATPPPAAAAPVQKEEKSDFPDPPQETEQTAQEPEVVDLLNDTDKKKILAAFEKFKIKQGLIEGVLGISINGWTEPMKTWLLQKYHALNDGALDNAGFSALNYEG